MSADQREPESERVDNATDFNPGANRFRDIYLSKSQTEPGPKTVDSGTFGELPDRIRALFRDGMQGDGGHVWDNMPRDDQRRWLIERLDVTLGGLAHESAIIAENAELLAGARAGEVSAVLQLARVAVMIARSRKMEHADACQGDETCTCGAVFARELYSVATSAVLPPQFETPLHPLDLLAACEENARLLAQDIESRLTEPREERLSRDERASIEFDAEEERKRERTFRALFAIVGRTWLYEFAADRLAGAV